MTRRDLPSHCNTSNVEEAVLSSVGLGALLSRVSCTGIADRFGRRAAIFAADMLIVTSIGLQSSTRSVGLFFLSRFLVGMGMGLAFVVTPYLPLRNSSTAKERLVYLSE